ncbi:hypothetical protein MTO96_038949 [Rhipicephalus appendiculatus]
MATNQPKRPRKEYLHHSQSFTLPKSTYYAALENGEADGTEATASTSTSSSADAGESRSPAVQDDADAQPLLADGDVDEAPLIAERCDFGESGAGAADEVQRSESEAGVEDYPALDDIIEDITDAEIAALSFGNLSGEKLPNIGTSQAGAVAMAMSFAVAHGLTWAALGDLAGLVNSIVGG